MTAVNDIINKLKSDMVDSIQTARGYNTDPAIKYGVVMQTEAPSLPMIGFCDDGIEFNNLLGGCFLGYLKVFIYMYANWGGVESTETIRDLALDVMYFLHNDFSYTNDTAFVGPMDILPGNDTHPVSVASVEIKVKFSGKYVTMNK